MPRFAIALASCAALAFSHEITFAQAVEADVPPPSPEVAVQDDSWIDPVADVRYRYEFVDQEDFALDAYASTVRARLGVLAKPLKTLSFYAEGEAVLHVGPDKFNDTTNGVIDRPVVTDPEDILLNQLYARFRPHPGASMTAGRQTVNYDWRSSLHGHSAVRSKIFSLSRPNQIGKPSHELVAPSHHPRPSGPCDCDAADPRPMDKTMSKTIISAGKIVTTPRCFRLITRDGWETGISIDHGDEQLLWFRPKPLEVAYEPKFDNDQRIADVIDFTKCHRGTRT